MFGTDEVSSNLIRRKLHFIMIVIIVGFCVLVVRLGYLQIVCTKYYTSRSEDNRIRPVRLTPPRGVLYDRYGKEPLADNETVFDVCVAPTKADYLWNLSERRREALLRLNLAPEEILEKLNASRAAVFEPVVIKEDVDKDIAAYLAESGSHIPEIIIRARPRRCYKNLAAHVIGYTAPVGREDLKNGYVLSDVIGKAGVEAQYEEDLKGDMDWKMVEVNAFGHIVRDLPLPVKAEPGHSLNLMLDLKLQRKAEALLEGTRDPAGRSCRGAIIAMDTRSGEILAMASKPDFDPNIFAGGCSEADWNELISSRDNPLLNRAVMGEYPPGSTFKIVTATAALESGKINENTRFYCNGKFHLGNWTFRCHKPDGHGSVDIRRALAESCNVFFYNVAHQKGVTVSMMHKYALMYGLGKKTGIDLPGERWGFVPKIGRFPGDKINMCIGQGELLVTPLQMANLICVIANRGFSYKPHIVNQSRGHKPEILIDLRSQVSRETIEVIRNALKDVVGRGSSQQANLPDHQTAGKTGSAQNPHGDEHAWFIGFAPFDGPEIAVVVIVENAGRGSEVAAPMAGQIFAEYFGTVTKDQSVVNRGQANGGTLATNDY
jgi:penicillin-binding protein 2